MPIYRYKCRRCHAELSEFHKMDEKPEITCRVPGCDDKMEKKVVKTSFSLKGGGWYKDGY